MSPCILAPGKQPGGSLSLCGLGHCRPLRKGTDVSLMAAGPVSLSAQVPAGAPPRSGEGAQRQNACPGWWFRLAADSEEQSPHERGTEGAPRACPPC